MKTEFFAITELVALVSPLFFLATSLLVKENWKNRLLLFGQILAFGFAFTAFLFAAIMSGSERLKMDLAWIKIDLVASGLISAITFIAAIVTVFSERYLGGEKSRRKFIMGLSMLCSFSVLLAASDNMFVAIACWHLLSWSLWWTMRLEDDVQSNKSASTVLAHHLLSDSLLLSAILIVYSTTGEASFSKLPSMLPLLHSCFNLAGFSAALSVGMVASILLVLSFSIKSALFPFHRWLLATLDAPTPLSGVLHAGVVNVSAILAWRSMPLLQDYSFVLIGWGCLSALSAIVGTLSMSAQPDVKKKLVYSTVGQMGFMCLQCASGAIAAALFHLVAHGLFKCHLFLQSGTAVAEGLDKRKFAHGVAVSGEQPKTKLFAFALAVFCCAIVFLLYFDAGSTALSAIITAAAISCAVPALARVEYKMLLSFWTAALLAVLFSLLASIKFESAVHFASSTAFLLPASLCLFALIAVTLRLNSNSRMAKALYVHSLNGFYAEEVLLAARKSIDLRRNNDGY